MCARNLSFDNNRFSTVSMLIEICKDLPGVAVVICKYLAMCSQLPTTSEYVWRHSHHHVSFSTVGYSCTSPMHLLARFCQNLCSVISSINTHILSQKQVCKVLKRACFGHIPPAKISNDRITFLVV